MQKKFLEQLEATHSLFKSFVGKFRPQMDLTKVATGEYWFGQDALKMGLVDEILTSDDYIMKKMNDNKLIKLSFEKKPSLSEKISGFVSEAVSSSVQKTFQRVASMSAPQNDL